MPECVGTPEGARPTTPTPRTRDSIAKRNLFGSTGSSEVPSAAASSPDAAPSTAAGGDMTADL